MSTTLHRLSQWANEDGDAVAQRYKMGGHWHEITAREYMDRVFYITLWLESKGFGPDEVSSILSYNKPEWVHLDLAAMFARGLSAGLYPNASFKDIRYVLDHTKCKFLSVQNEMYYNKATNDGAEPLPSHIEHIIVFEGTTSFSDKAISYDDVIAEGKKIAQSKTIEEYLDRLVPTDGAFLIYTSGTTGNPKGALLSHDNLVYAIDIGGKHWGMQKNMGSTFSFLPLCHIAEKIQNLGAGITYRLRTDYCSGFENISSDLLEVKPSLLLSVPRLWEKMVEGVTQKLEGATGVKKHLANWSFKVGEEHANVRYAGKTPGALLNMKKALAEKLVLSKVKEAMGLNNVQVAASGAAALPAYVSNWFKILDIEIFEVFGQTESAGIICMTRPGEESSGTVGTNVAGTEFKIAEDGEILSKGRHVFCGYYKNDQATAETVIDGWLHSGDLGKVNDRGLVQIVGRKKEIMKTSGGKMVAPVPIEELIKECPKVGQACMVGDGKKYFSMLITLAEGEKLTPDVEKEIIAKKDEVNNQLAGYEQIKYLTILENDFSIDRGEMTPTMKMKRAIIEQNYSSEISSMYN